MNEDEHVILNDTSVFRVTQYCYGYFLLQKLWSQDNNKISFMPNP